MVKYCVTLIFLFSFPPAMAEFCNWGFMGAKTIYCDGDAYVYGTAACESGIYHKIFCAERFYDDGRACAEDESRKTIDCYNRMISPTSPNEDQEFCNWGWAGPKYIRCRGKTYVYGSTACPSGFYQNIFCEERYSASGRECEEDSSPDTVACFNQFIGVIPRANLSSRGWPKPQSQGNQGTWPKGSR